MKNEKLISIKNFSNNVFDRTILSTKEFEEMIDNLINIVKILCNSFSDNNQSNKIIQKMAVEFGILEQGENFFDILKKNFLLKSELIKALTTIAEEDLLKNNDVKKFHRFIREDMVRKAKETNVPTLVDLFCGSGGLSLGLVQSGMKIIFANDIEKSALRTYNFNHQELDGKNITMGGIENLAHNLSSYINQDVDVLAGGPPCQGFSMANRQRIIDDPRNILYKYYVESLKNIQPKVFIMENVKPMMKVSNQVIEDIEKNVPVKYSIAVDVLNARNFGIPQNRERLFFIGIREDISRKRGIDAHDIMNTIKSNIMEDVPLGDALFNLKPLEASKVKNSTEKGDEISGYKISRIYKNETNDYLEKINLGHTTNLVFNHKARYNNDRDIEIYGRMIQGDNSNSSRIKDIMPYKSRKHIFKDKYYKLVNSIPCKTITAHMKFDCNMYIHPNQARGLTPREAARIQSYPDDYLFLGAYTKTYQQIGNSVPPIMGRKIGEIILNCIFKK